MLFVLLAASALLADEGPGDGLALAFRDEPFQADPLTGVCLAPFTVRNQGASVIGVAEVIGCSCLAISTLTSPAIAPGAASDGILSVGLTGCIGDRTKEVRLAGIRPDGSRVLSESRWIRLRDQGPLVVRPQGLIIDIARQRRIALSISLDPRVVGRSDLRADLEFDPAVFRAVGPAGSLLGAEPCVVEFDCIVSDDGFATLSAQRPDDPLSEIRIHTSVVGQARSARYLSVTVGLRQRR